MKSTWNIKRTLVAMTLLWVGGGIAPLFAAPNDNLAQQQQQLQQVQQLQQLPPPPQVQQPIAQPVPPPPDMPPQTLGPPQVVTSNPQAPSLPALPPPSQLPPPTAVAPPPPPAAANGPQDGVVSADAIRGQAFNAMVQDQLPMTPDQIQRLRQLFNQSQFAAASTPGTPPRPTATSQLVNLAPGSTPPVIRLAQGFITSLVFIDSSGAPWPIQNYDIGNPTAFNIQWNKSDNTLMIQATTLYTYGNLAVRLQGLNTPVMLTLIPGQKAVDYRVDMRIPLPGPNAVPVPVVGLPSPANPELMSVLDGVPPTGTTEVHVCSPGVQAWIRGDQMFVRTRYTVLSPGWIATMSSADGMKAYQMSKTPLLLAAENGKIVQFKIEGL